MAQRNHSTTGSLARRILTVSILLLVIPLFLQDLFLSRQEYNERIEAAQNYLQTVAEERSLLLEQLIQLNWELLGQTPQKETFFRDTTGNVKRLYMVEKIPLPRGVSEQFVWVSDRRKALLIGKKQSELEALVVVIPFSLILRDEEKFYPIQMTLQQRKETAPAEATLTAVQPIQGTDLSLQLTLSKGSLKKLQLENYYFRLATLVFFVGILGGGSVYWLTRRIARPLKHLSQVMMRVSEGASHVRYTPDSMGFEINEIGKQFNEMMDGLLRYAQQAEKERIARERLAEELRIGHDIQASLLPSRVPGLPNLDIGAANLSAREVNGDFYDLFPLENGKWLLVMCDIAGKGISACLYAVGLRSMLRSVVSLVDDLGEIVQKANDLFWLDAHEHSLFATLWIGLFDPKTLRLTYCSQGHPPALLRRGISIQELGTEGIALGAQKREVIPTQEISLTAGDLLLCYTDGIIEAHDPYSHLFGKQRLKEFILRKKRETAQQVVDQLIEEVHLFSQGTPQHDDMSLFVLKIQ